MILKSNQNFWINGEICGTIITNYGAEIMYQCIVSKVFSRTECEIVSPIAQITHSVCASTPTVCCLKVLVAAQHVHTSDCEAMKHLHCAHFWIFQLAESYGMEFFETSASANSYITEVGNTVLHECTFLEICTVSSYILSMAFTSSFL